MTRFWPDGLAITVIADTLAAPVAFIWNGRRHQVAWIVERWRVDEDWWKRRAWREYFHLVTRGGLLALIYHDIRTGQWRLQRVYD